MAISPAEQEVYRRGVNQMRKLSGMYLHDAPDSNDGNRPRRLLQQSSYKGVKALKPSRSKSKIGSHVSAGSGFGAYVMDKGQCAMLGKFDNPVKAARARDVCVRHMFGPAAPLNFPIPEEEGARARAVASLKTLGLKLLQGVNPTAAQQADEESDDDHNAHEDASDNRGLMDDKDGVDGSGDESDREEDGSSDDDSPAKVQYPNTVVVSLRV